MSDPIANRPYRGRIAVEVEERFLLTRAEALPARPVVVIHEMGEAQPRDVIWSSTVGMVIVSQHVIDILLDNRFTGWSTYPVEVYSKGGDLVPGYYGLSITGRCGVVDPSMSEIVLEKFPGGWFPRFEGVFFDPKYWDGSHFFKEIIDPSKGTGLGGIFITSEVYSVFRKAKVRNVELERLSEMRVSASIYEVRNKLGLPADYRERLDAAYRNAGVPVPKRYADLPL